MLLVQLIVIQLALLVAVQGQPSCVLTLTLLEPPKPSKDALVGESEKLQVSGWVTVKVCPAIVIVPVRAAPVVLAATE